MSAEAVALAAQERVERLAFAELDARIDLLLAHGADRFEKVTADPRKMGYLRFLLKHYAKSATPWTDCYKDNLKRFGPERTKGLCLAPDTPVSTPRGLVDIADLRPGDMVWSYDGENFVQRPVLWSGLTRRDAEVMRLEIEDEIEVYATPDHPFLRYRGEWSEVQDLRAGEFLLGPLSSVVDTSVISAALSAVALAFSDAACTNTEILGPRMPVGAMRSIFDFLTTRFDLLVLREDLGDLLLSSRRHQRFDYAHNCDSWSIVDAPLEALVPVALIAAEFPDFSHTERFNESLKRLGMILRGDHTEIPATGTILQVALGTIEPKTAFSFQKASGVSDILGREITKVALAKEHIDVWDIEVGDTHNFVVHDFIIAHNCGVLKDVIRQNPLWRHGAPRGPHPGHPDSGTPGVAIGEADKWAAPAWGGHHHMSEDGRPLSLLDELDMEFGVVDHEENIVAAAEVLCAIGERCDVYRVLIGLDEPPTFEEDE